MAKKKPVIPPLVSKTISKPKKPKASADDVRALTKQREASDAKIKMRLSRGDNTEEASIESTPKKKFLALALQRWHLASEAETSVRKEALDDLEFSIGNQWDQQIQSRRQLDGRPCLTINRLPQFIRLVTNEQRQQRPAIQINPVGDGATRETARVLQGMVRHIEVNSDAEVPYDTGAEFAVRIGFGYWHLIREYLPGKTFNQEIKIKRIKNPFTVYFDPACVEHDYSDAEWAFIIEDISREEFTRDNPDSEWASLTSLTSIGDVERVWATKDTIRIALYYYVEYTPRELAYLDDGTVQWYDELTDEEKERIELRRTVQERTVKCAKISALDVLEGNEDKTAGEDIQNTYIPIIPVLADDFDVNGKRYVAGLVRAAKDPQRMYNFWVSCPLFLDTPIPTPSGWSTIGKVRENDIVFDENGQMCRVTGKSPIYRDRTCFKIKFDDGSEILSDSLHSWSVEERGKRKTATWDWKEKIVKTKQLVPGKHFIIATKPLDLPDADLLVRPYLLGIWLGDGNSVDPTIKGETRDLLEIRNVIAREGDVVGDLKYSWPSDIPNFRVHGVRKRNKTTRALLKRLGVLNNKHIPAQYLRASSQQRYRLLQGLMDTDGWINSHTRQCGFTTTSKILADGFAELLSSLGIKFFRSIDAGKFSEIIKGKVVWSKPQAKFLFSPGENEKVFRLSRKALLADKPRHWRRTKRYAVRSIEEVKSVPVQCLTVDSPSHLFLVGKTMIPTHNSTEMIALAPRAPFIGAKGQFKSKEEMWRQANIRNFAFLEYDTVSVEGQAVGPPQRNSIEPPIQAISSMVRQADNDLKGTTGIYDASLGQKGPDESGKAILTRQRQGDVATLNFSDNLSRSIRHTGRVILAWIPTTYDKARIQRIINPDQTVEHVGVFNSVLRKQSKEEAMQELMPGQEDGTVQDPGIKQVFDIGVGIYDVTVTTGPSYQSKRQEAVQAMMTLVNAYPALMQAAGDLLVRNMDWPGAQAIADRLQKLLPPPLQDVNSTDPKVQVTALQAQLQQLMQQHTIVVQELNKASDLIRTKKFELESKERIAERNASVQLLVAEAKVQGEAALQKLDGELQMIMHRLDLLKDNQSIESEDGSDDALPPSTTPPIGGGTPSGSAPAAPAAVPPMQGG